MKTGDEVRPRPFASASLNAAIDRALARVPDGHIVAFVAAAGIDKGQRVAEMVVNVRVDDRWSFGGFVKHANVDGFSTGAELRYSR